MFDKIVEFNIKTIEKISKVIRLLLLTTIKKEKSGVK